MSRKFLESDVVDSKIFEGRVLTLLGEILRNQNSLRVYLEDAFHVPEEYQRKGKDTDYEESEDDIPDEEDE